MAGAAMARGIPGGLGLLLHLPVHLDKSARTIRDCETSFDLSRRFTVFNYAWSISRSFTGFDAGLVNAGTQNGFPVPAGQGYQLDEALAPFK